MNFLPGYPVYFRIKMKVLWARTVPLPWAHVVFCKEGKIYDVTLLHSYYLKLILMTYAYIAMKRRVYAFMLLPYLGLLHFRN